MHILPFSNDALDDVNNIVYLLENLLDVRDLPLTEEEKSYAIDLYKPEKRDLFVFNRFTYSLVVQVCPTKAGYKTLEYLRKAGDKVQRMLRRRKQSVAVIRNTGADNDKVIAFAEGFALGAYEFKKYKSSLKEIIKTEKLLIDSPKLTEGEINTLNHLVHSCYKVRDMVNEPVNVLDSLNFADQIKELADGVGLHAKILGKKDIEDLGMTGLLTVNLGSTKDPAFIILEWKPDNAVNENPLVLVGKGLVFDTGGINLKPGHGLDAMKSDMAGGAAVFGAIYALALNKVPFYTVALIPVTDNRPGENAMVPGDIIRMANGKTVEIINTDAEGRLILADALHYAKKYSPMLVIDAATLTGAASVAIGRFGIAAMQQDAEDAMKKLIESGYQTYERVVEFPFWEEYDKEIESDVADIRNIGRNRGAGTITAGKFLANFVDYPFIHLDIATMAYMDARESWMGKGGTAIGVRLLYNFIDNEAQNT